VPSPPVNPVVSGCPPPWQPPCLAPPGFFFLHQLSCGLVRPPRRGALGQGETSPQHSLALAAPYLTHLPAQKRVTRTVLSRVLCPAGGACAAAWSDQFGNGGPDANGEMSARRRTAGSRTNTFMDLPAGADFEWEGDPRSLPGRAPAPTCSMLDHNNAPRCGPWRRRTWAPAASEQEDSHHSRQLLCAPPSLAIRKDLRCSPSWAWATWCAPPPVIPLEAGAGVSLTVTSRSPRQLAPAQLMNGSACTSAA